MKVTKQEQWLYDKTDEVKVAADAAVEVGILNTVILALGAAALFFAGLTINEKLDRIPKDCPSTAVTYYHSFSSDFSN